MQRRLNSFLLRFWDRADGTVRIEIEHIQEGARVVVDSTAVALSWIDARATADRARELLDDEGDPPRNGTTSRNEPPP
jgi:hypothetical protein